MKCAPTLSCIKNNALSGIMMPMNEETIQAARAAFKRDPETACQAMLGCSAEEMFVTALRGCNQHKHKPGCPDASGAKSDSGSSWAERWLSKSDEEKLKAYENDIKKYEDKVKKTGDYNDFTTLKTMRGKAARLRKKIAGSVLSEIDDMYREVRSIHEKNGTEFLRNAGVNIIEADNGFSRARGAALFAESNPSSERWGEALADMKRGSEELREVFRKLGGRK